MDFNDAPEQRQDGIIPDGTFARVKMAIRPGGYTMPNSDPGDAGLMTQSRSSDVVMLDGEFTVLAGPHRARKFWQNLTVAGGQIDAEGQSKGWLITKGTIRAMIDSALGCDPKDMSDATRQKRIMQGFKDLDGIEFVAKIGVERGGDAPNGGRYSDKNRLAHVVTPNEPEYAVIMGGGEVAARPGGASAAASLPRRSAAPQSAKPAWQQAAAPAAMPAQDAPPAAATAPARSGPAWLNG